MRHRPPRTDDLTIASIGHCARIPTVNLPGVPIRVTTLPSCFWSDDQETDVHVRRGSVLVYKRDIEKWVLFRTVHDAMASCDHALRGYGIEHMLPGTELARLDNMILELDGARDIMTRWTSMTTHEYMAALRRLEAAATEYRSPRVEDKVQARDWLIGAAASVAPATEAHPGRGRGRNPGAALAQTLPARAALRRREHTIREGIAPNLQRRAKALAREIEYCLALFGRLAEILNEIRAEPILGLPPRQVLSEIRHIDRPIVAWDRCMHRLGNIARLLGAHKLPAPYSRYVKRVSQELLRAAIELESRNFQEAKSLIDIALRSLDFLLFSQRIAEAKEELADLERRGALAADYAKVNQICVTLYGLACLLDDRGFFNGTRGRLLDHLRSSLVEANKRSLSDVRDSWTLASRMLG